MLHNNLSLKNEDRVINLALSFLLSNLWISAETVEKSKLQDFKVYNYLILLHAKFEKMPKLGFFYSLAMYSRNFKVKIFTDITMPVKLFVAQILAM